MHSFLVYTTHMPHSFFFAFLSMAQSHSFSLLQVCCRTGWHFQRAGHHYQTLTLACCLCVWVCVDLRMAVFSQSSSLLWTSLFMAMLALLTGVCLGGSDSPRGVSLPFVFDLNAVCDPPCRHAGICIRNSTCLCSWGYEGETCQYGDVSTLYLFNKCGRLWGCKECVWERECVYMNAQLYTVLHFAYLYSKHLHFSSYGNNYVSYKLRTLNVIIGLLISANCEPKCKNGGKCLRPGKCRCPSGLGGKYCEKGIFECFYSKLSLL